MSNFWSKLPKPFFVLAPMANVTDYVFRTMITKYGKPDVMWTEFVSADGLISAGKEKLLIDLKFSKKERPIVAQLFTGHPDAMREASRLCAELGFDGLDINMGCPDRAVEKQGGGSAMIKDPKNALAVLQAAREGWVNGSVVKTQSVSEVRPPTSIKTRIGYNKIDMGWIELLLKQGLPALTIHLRTRKEMSDVPAHWELMPEIVKLRDEVQKDLPKNERTLIIGNGDAESIADGLEKAKKYGCDGVMIGRGIFGRPWLFGKSKDVRWEEGKMKDEKKKTRKIIKTEFDPTRRLEIMLEHTKLFEKTYCGKKRIKNFAVMKKHFKAYVSGWDGARELRTKLMETESYGEVRKIVKKFNNSTPTFAKAMMGKKEQLKDI